PLSASPTPPSCCHRLPGATADDAHPCLRFTAADDVRCHIGAAHRPRACRSPTSRTMLRMTSPTTELRLRALESRADDHDTAIEALSRKMNVAVVKVARMEKNLGALMAHFGVPQVDLTEDETDELFDA